MTTRPWIQVELKLLPGAEPWLAVRHQGRVFKVPAFVAAFDIIDGVSNRWDMRGQRHTETMYIRLPWAEYRRLLARDGTPAQRLPDALDRGSDDRGCDS